MPRNDDLKAYTTLMARIPQDLADQVKQYAHQHRCSVSELIRDGLEMRLESGEVPGRSTGHHGDAGDDVIHEVLQVIPEVIHRISPMLLAQMQDMIRTTVTEVLQGMTEVVPGHTSIPQPDTHGMPAVLPFETPSHASTVEGITEVLQESMPPIPPTDSEGMTEVLLLVPPIIQPAPGVFPGDTSTPPPHAPIPEEGMTEVLHGPPDFDATRFALGELCINQHEYQETGQTLYRLPKYACPPCDAARARERRARRTAAQPQEG